MRWGTKIGIMLLAVALVSTPFLASAGYEGKKIEVSTTVLTPVGKEVKIIELSEKDVKLLEKKAIEVEDAIKILTDPNADDDEKSLAMEIIEAFINKLIELGLIPAGFPVAKILANFLSPKMDFLLPIISFGRGFSWIPLYPGEAFIGFMFRPIIMQYFLLGYTASLNVRLLPPRIEYWDMVGTHTLIVWGFVGIYIDFGKIGYGIPRLQFLMGEALLAGGVDWL
ncbi:MAG: hypothetical protein DRN29_00955 [Thermoplasmata archaeon]|nr:MAG: hypothetical protein DRN29_00955 [Thermoplasmata archaeon]